MKRTFNFFCVISALMTIFVLFSCKTQVNNDVTVESVSLSETTKAKLNAMVVMDKVELSSIIKYSNGESKPIDSTDKKLKYKIPENSCCSMALDGVTLSADRAGDVDITPVYEGIDESRLEKFSFTVKPKSGPATLDTIEVSPKTIVLKIGSTADLPATVTAKYSDGSSKSVTPTYSSNDTSETFIKLTGLTVKGIKAGSAKIVAKFEGKTDTIDVTVNSVIAPTDVLKTFSVTPASITLRVGDTIDLSAKLTAKAVYDKAGEITVAPVYTSDNPGMAQVTGTSLKGVKNGTTKLTATYTDSNGNTKTAKVDVNVTPATLESIALAPSAKTVSVAAYETVELTKTATARYSDGSTKTVTVTYTMGNNDYASLAGYNVTGKKAGNATATATFEGKTDTVTVKVTASTATDGSGNIGFQF